ncbi:MAG: hypothetical protein ABS882_01750, partial [Lysinibacillus sp.]
TFNKDINPDSVHQNSIIITNQQNKMVNVQFRVYKNIVAILAPEEGYQYGQQYSLELTDQLLSSNNKPVKNAQTKTFVIHNEQSTTIENIKNYHPVEQSPSLEEMYSYIFLNGNWSEKEDVVLFTGTNDELKYELAYVWKNNNLTPHALSIEGVSVNPDVLTGLNEILAFNAKRYRESYQQKVFSNYHTRPVVASLDNNLFGFDFIYEFGNTFANPHPNPNNKMGTIGGATKSLLVMTMFVEQMNASVDGTRPGPDTITYKVEKFLKGVEDFGEDPFGTIINWFTKEEEKEIYEVKEEEVVVEIDPVKLAELQKKREEQLQRERARAKESLESAQESYKETLKWSNKIFVEPGESLIYTNELQNNVEISEFFTRIFYVIDDNGNVSPESSLYDKGDTLFNFVTYDPQGNMKSAYFEASHRTLLSIPSGHTAVITNVTKRPVYVQGIYREILENGRTNVRTNVLTAQRTNETAVQNFTLTKDKPLTKTVQLDGVIYLNGTGTVDVYEGDIKKTSLDFSSSRSYSVKKGERLVITAKAAETTVFTGSRVFQQQ